MRAASGDEDRRAQFQDEKLAQVGQDLGPGEEGTRVTNARDRGGFSVYRTFRARTGEVPGTLGQVSHPKGLKELA